jgi:multidrug efflux pump subunit AcrA (membrane-fusion protein)
MNNPLQRRPNLILAGALIMVLGSLFSGAWGIGGLGGVSAGADTPTAPAGDLVFTVQRGPLCEKTLYHGETQARQSVSIHVPEMRDEHLLTVKTVLNDGDRVKKGDIVVTFDDSGFIREGETAKNELELAQAELERTRFELHNRRVDLDLGVQRRELELEKARVSVVENSTIISKIDLEKAKLSVKLAEMELEQARKARREFDQEYKVGMEVRELQLKEARRKLDRQTAKVAQSQVQAPQDGIIFKPFVRLNNEKGRVEPGKVVSPGDKILELPNLSDFQGIVFINPSDNRFVKEGDAVDLRLLALPEKPFRGVVQKKDGYPITRNERLGRNDPEGSLEENQVTIEITDRDPLLRPGMSFRAEITSVIASDCLFVPRIAVFPDQASGSFVLIPNTSPAGFETRPVTTGRAGISFVEVLSGLREGERISLLNLTPATDENAEP